MARRSEILAETRMAPVVEGVVEDPEEDEVDLEEDLYEAVDLIETSLKILTRLNERRHSTYISNHCIDLQQFLAEMLGEGDKGE